MPPDASTKGNYLPNVTNQLQPCQRGKTPKLVTEVICPRFLSGYLWRRPTPIAFSQVGQSYIVSRRAPAREIVDPPNPPSGAGFQSQVVRFGHEWRACCSFARGRRRCRTDRYSTRRPCPGHNRLQPGKYSFPSSMAPPGVSRTSLPGARLERYRGHGGNPRRRLSFFGAASVPLVPSVPTRSTERKRCQATAVQNRPAQAFSCSRLNGNRALGEKKGNPGEIDAGVPYDQSAAASDGSPSAALEQPHLVTTTHETTSFR